MTRVRPGITCIWPVVVLLVLSGCYAEPPSNTSVSNLTPVAGTPVLMNKHLKKLQERTGKPDWYMKIPCTPSPEKKLCRRKSTWKRSSLTANSLRLMVGDRECLPLKKMQVFVRIHGFRARVVLDCSFLNNRRHRLEGTFQIRLPDEASPYYFAFGQTRFSAPSLADIPGRDISSQGLHAAGLKISHCLKEARMVPRQTAVTAYQDTVRRRIDPALVEWSGAGVFNAHVFPLAARRLHRIVIAYDINLRQSGVDLVYNLDLPGKRGQCTIDIQVARMPGVGLYFSPEPGPKRSTAMADNTLAIRRYVDFRGSRICVQQTGANNLLMIGTDSSTGDYFAAHCNLPDTDEQADHQAKAAIFLLDTSMSTSPENFNNYLLLMQAILRQNRNTLREFALLTFNVQTHWWQKHMCANTPQNVRACMDFANRLSLQGATDLGTALREAMDLRKTGWVDEVDFFLLSDAQVTWGENNARLLGALLRNSHATLYGYDIGGSATRMLNQITEATGGAVFSLTGQNDIRKAAQAHCRRPWKISRIVVPGASDLVSSVNTWIYPGQKLVLAGRGRPTANAVILALERGNQQREITISLTHQVASNLAPRVYGEFAVRMLESLGSKNYELAKAYATHFRIVGRTCALLMLETEQDFQRYNIRPAEDTFVIKQRSIADIMQQFTTRDRSLTARDVFLDWLKSLASTPDLAWNPSAALEIALAAMPEQAFEVRQKAVSSNQRDQAVRSKRNFRKLDYLRLNREAMRQYTANDPADAIIILSSLVEKSPGNIDRLREVAFQLMAWNYSGHAYYLLRNAARQRPAELINFRTMGLALAHSNNPDLAIICFEIALGAGTLSSSSQSQGLSISGAQNLRNAVLLDYLHLLGRIARGELQSSVPEFAASRYRTLLAECSHPQQDMTASIMWSTRAGDVDLIVKEPGNQTCYPGKNSRTTWNQHYYPPSGSIDWNIRNGLGPEIYTLPRACAGQYRIIARYNNQSRLRTSQCTRVLATIYTNWGRPNVTCRQTAVLLRRGKENSLLKKILTLHDGREARTLARISFPLKPRANTSN